MTKKEVGLLISPGAIFLLIGAVLWMIGSAMMKQGGATNSQDDEQRFEAFVLKAQKGETPLTPELMVEAMRRSRAVTHATLQASASIGTLLHTLALGCVFGVILQVFEVRRLARRPMAGEASRRAASNPKAGN